MAKLKEAGPAAAPAQPGAPGGAAVTGIALFGSDEISTTKQLPEHFQPNDPFIFAFDPRRWVVLAGKIVPDLRMYRCSPGVNGVSNDNGKPGYNHLLANIQQQGCVPLMKTSEYLGKTEVRGGYHYHDLWTRLVPGTATPRANVEGYVAWLESKLADGTIPPPSLDALEASRGAAARSRDKAAVAIFEAEINRRAGNVAAAPSEAVELGIG